MHFLQFRLDVYRPGFMLREHLGFSFSSTIWKGTIQQQEPQGWLLFVCITWFTPKQDQCLYDHNASKMLFIVPSLLLHLIFKSTSIQVDPVRQSKYKLFILPPLLIYKDVMRSWFCLNVYEPSSAVNFWLGSDDKNNTLLKWQCSSKPFALSLQVVTCMLNPSTARNLILILLFVQTLEKSFLSCWQVAILEREVKRSVSF